jgi:hypothetical protein
MLFRFMKVEEARHKREMEYQQKQIEIENKRREQEMEHELKLFQLLLEHKPTYNQHGSLDTMLPLSMATSSTSPLPHNFQFNQWGHQNNSMYQPMASSSTSDHLCSDQDAEYTTL